MAKEKSSIRQEEESSVKEKERLMILQDQMKQLKETEHKLQSEIMMLMKLKKVNWSIVY